MKTQILLIEDDPGITITLQRLLAGEGHEVVVEKRGDSGLARARADAFDVVLSDLKLPGLSGLDLVRELHDAKPRLPIILMTAHGTTETAIEATKRGAVDYLLKPFEMPELLEVVSKALATSRLMSEPVSLGVPGDTRDTIIGSSRGMQAIYKELGRVAAKPVNVLIRGETGTGKELIARALCQHSDRVNGAFIAINCAAIPETLLESELFGHERGAFTGAEARRIGRFEQAHNGTIFLDEIGDMSPKTQAKVLRVLQEQEVERLGSARTIKVDVRVIAATNKNLEETIQRGEFREDLYFRLNVIPIVVPPLRERREDIPQLVQHFAKRTSDEHNLKPKRFDPRAMEAMQRYRWRGNIRELRNTIERLMIMTAADLVRVEDLPAEIRGQVPLGQHAADTAASAPATAATPGAGTTTPPAGTLREFKDTAERAYLVQKLRENSWNISKTAEVIDTPRSNLYKKLEQYGIKQDIDG
jgi:DNA-binding NtrC family response regulator